MVYYECFRCGYCSIHRNSMKNHLNRKNICNPIRGDMEIQEIKKYYSFDNNKKPTENMHPNDTQTTPKQHPNSTFDDAPKQHPNDTQTTPKQHPNDTQTAPKLSTRECKYCKKIFTRKSGLTKHLSICKMKKESEILIINQNEEMNKMKKEIEELKKINIQTQNNITNNNHNINNSKNIYINNYGDENIKHLRSKDFANLLNGIYSAVPKLIEKIHFDPEHPENQNIKYTNQKSPYMKVIKDSKWQFVGKKEELLDLIDNKCFMLKEKYYALLEKKKYNITDNQRNKIEEFMEKYHEDDKKIILDLIERTELMLLNNS